MRGREAVDSTDVHKPDPELIWGDEGPTRRSARFVKRGLVAIK